MIKQQKDVTEFHKTFDIPTAEIPKMLDDAAKNRRVNLIIEETDEFIDALDKEDIIETIDALVDLLYVTYGAAVELGVDLEPFWNEVQRSNMTKIGGYKNEYGKWIKPDNYSPADIKGVFKDVY